ncbi:5-oxoprolinase subunit B family protein [Streptacidiphilus jiangxiensis]|uniref:Sensor histidine kinase inhibitor, KipI family n=1 Tax=Streptacidiphilus jiangxiensis TaxID=235985 RepID=A0A1H7UD23_STRJI|nr:allophanate hydrolase subunit 1 [Streptacidiphilus jiangxiensis]SEL94568.1 sensor histidine kinase inhibitor, KipI family [Streptacidiphilus jiangxiensis]
MGPRALLAEVTTDDQVSALLADLVLRQQAGALGADVELVPAARTVLVDGLADARERTSLAAWLAAWEPHAGDTGTGPLLEVPTVYDGEDLPEVAALWGLSPADAARRHAACEFRVAFCGFSPGFAYLTGLPADLAVPRRATPRTRVPAGSVAVAGAYTGVYPSPSPGGWQLIGHTTLRLWDEQRTPAALLTPGTRVRFVPVTEGATGR